MNNQGFQTFTANPQPQTTQVYPDGTVRIVQNSNQVITAAIQPSQDQHLHQHPQIIQNSSVMNGKIQSQAVYYSQNQGQNQQTVIMKSSLGNNSMTTPPMSFNSTVYSAQGQNQQSVPIYSSPMNIQIANTPPNNAINTIANNADGNNTVIVAQQNGVLNEMSSSYTVAQPIQTQETKNYSNQVFVIPSPSTPTPQMSYTTSTTSHSTIVQVQQQTPPQQAVANTSQYIITQKSGQGMSVPSTQQVILQAPPTPYGTSPTSNQVQVIAQGGQNNDIMNVGNYVNTTMVSPTQIQYQYSVTPPLTNDNKDGKVSPEMSISGEKEEGSDKTMTATDSKAAFSSSLISNPGRLFNKISISSPTSTSLYSVDSSLPVDINNQTQEKEATVIKKEGLSPAGSEKGKLEHSNSMSQNNGKSQAFIKEEMNQLMDTSETSAHPNANPDSSVHPPSNTNMTVDKSENVKIESGDPINNLAITTMANTTMDSSLMNSSLTSPQALTGHPTGIIQTTPVNDTTQNMNMISNINTLQGVGVNVGLNSVNKINVMNGMNNVNYIPANMNIPGATPANVNLNGINTVQVATAIPSTINTVNPMNTMNTMNVIPGSGNNLINISPNQSTVPLNANNSINLYYNQGPHVMNGTTPTTSVKYANSSVGKANTKRVGNYNTRTKNSHIVDPDVPIEVLIKRRKNTEAARRSRLRKAERIQVLTEIVHNLEEKNREYTIKIAELQGEQANWIKKETEYTTKIKQLQDKLNDSNPDGSSNDENDKNSFNISVPASTDATPAMETESTSATETPTTTAVAQDEDGVENEA